MSLVPAALLFGAFALPSHREPRPSTSRYRALIASTCFGLAVVALLAPSVLAADLQRTVDELRVFARDKNDSAHFQQRLDQALRQHPLEPAVALYAADHAVRVGDPSAPRWISYTMQRAPGWASPHLIAASWLHRLGHTDQALLEVRSAETLQKGSAKDVVCAWIRPNTRASDLKRAAPLNNDAAGFYNRAASCPSTTAALRTELDELVLQGDPTNPSAAIRKARSLLARGDSKAASQLLKSAVLAAPANASLALEEAELLLSSGDAEGAQKSLELARKRGCDLHTPSTLTLEAKIFAALGDRKQMQEILLALRGDASGDPQKLASAERLRGELEASQGQIEAALSAYESADAHWPKSDARLRAATLAENHGRTMQAIRSYEILCRRDHTSSACKRAETLSKQRATPATLGK
ncbi:MAG: hypothetical protein R3A47_07190 [Polyangiales bacterium]